VTHYPPREVTRIGSEFVTETDRWLRVRAHELGVPVPRGHGIRTPSDGEPVPFVVTNFA